MKLRKNTTKNRNNKTRNKLKVASVLLILSIPVTTVTALAETDQYGYTTKADYASFFGDNTDPNAVYNYTIDDFGYKTYYEDKNIDTSKPREYGSTGKNYSSTTPYEPNLTVGTFTTSVNNDGTLTITGYTGNTDLISIPSEINGVKVTKIGAKAFKGKGVQEVTIPEGITDISNSAFQNNSLKEIKLPKSLKTIEYNAFENNSINEIVIPDTVTNIESHTFGKNELSLLDLGKQMINIDTHAFSFNNLQDLYVPDTTLKIDSMAFAINDLKTVSVPSGIDIGDGFAFYGNEGVEVTYRPNLDYYEENKSVITEVFNWWK